MSPYLQCLILRFVVISIAPLLMGCELLALLVPDEESQGITGRVMFHPGVCLADPDHPGECLNKPYPGRAEIWVSVYSDVPDLGRDGLILYQGESAKDGRVRIALAPGKYCVWLLMETCTPVEVQPGEWREITLTVALP